MSVLVDGLLGRCSFPSPGQPVACAVSGGADSIALLVLAAAAGCEATAYHVDHGLRAGSSGEADVVARAAAVLGCGFVALSVDLEPGPNLEARARAARFAALPEEVATGHTADDQAETVLLNLVRGSGGSGVRAMRGGPRHPILDLRRTETVAVAVESGLELVDDPSNADLAIRRNRVRHELLPLMDEIAERDVVPLLARFAEVTGDEADLVELLAVEVDAASTRTVRSLPAPVARRVLRRFIRTGTGSPYPPDLATVDRALEVVRGGATACELGGGYLLRRSSGELVIVAPSDRRWGVR